MTSAVKMRERLPYKGYWKGDFLEAIINEGLKQWDEIRNYTGLLKDELNTALSELYYDGVIYKKYDGSYRVIPELYKLYKRDYDKGYC